MNTPEPVSENNEKSEKKVKKKMKKWQKILLIVLLTILGLLIAAALALYFISLHFYNKMNYVPLDEGSETIIYSIEDEKDEYDPEIDGEGDTVIVTDDQGNHVTDDQGSTVTTVVPPPIVEDPKVEEDAKDEIDNNISDDNDEIKVNKNVRNILLIGTDGLKVNDRGRSDSMILLTINENTGKITMTSFMRDVYLHIPTVDTYNRLNASYAYGGVPLLIDTIEENFKLEIEQYVRVNYEAFKYIIDTMGGVDIKLSQAEIDYLMLGKDVKPGLVHLNGEKALEYCRCRKVSKDGLSGDFARTARQREFLTIMSNKLNGLGVFELSELLDVFLPHVTTNIKYSEMMTLLANVPKYLDYEITSARIPADGSWEYARIQGKSVIKINYKKNIAALEKIING